jgi:hypothetical protein
MRRRSTQVHTRTGTSRSPIRVGCKGNGADSVVAATAGLDNWKTWAGRNRGTEEFELLDLFRGAKRSFHHRFLATPPPKGATCPVCFCEPEPQEWHVTSSCAHAVCLNCLKAYASNQVRDQEQQGPLKCPVCPQVLRRRDAIAALGSDKELVRQWDLKIRNQLLRALPSYRSCPKCSHNSEGGGGGGGFVTPDCLAPHYQERRETATRMLHGIWIVALLLLSVYVGIVICIGQIPSRSPLVDLFFRLALIYVLVKTIRASQTWVAQWARQAFLRPIAVECPCCDEPFILPAESKQLHDEKTSRWIDANTRPCPSCSVPIDKIGGCNHMRCCHCHASFCWACMRLGTKCATYACRNGAPYRNAVPGRSEDLRPPQLDSSILTTVDYILDRQIPGLKVYDAALVFMALFARDADVIQTTVAWTMTTIAAVFASGIMRVLVLPYTSWILFRSFREHYPIFTASEFILGAEQRNRRERERNLVMTTEQLEEQIVADAIRRSRREQ